MTADLWTVVALLVLGGIGWLWGFLVGCETTGRHYGGLLRMYRRRLIDAEARANRRADTARRAALHDRVALTDVERETVAELDERWQS